MSRKLLNQKGLTPILILVLLGIGLIGGVYAVQKARTVLNPRASESVANDLVSDQSGGQSSVLNKGENIIGYAGPTAPTKEGTYCTDYAKCEYDTAYIYHQNRRDSDGVCITDSKENTNKQCIKFFCDNLVYVDPNAVYTDNSGQEATGWTIHKYPVSYDSSLNSCNYAFTNLTHVNLDPQTKPGAARGIDESCKEEIYCDDRRDSEGKLLVGKFVRKYIKAEEPFSSAGDCNFVFDQLSTAASDCGSNKAADATTLEALNKQYGITPRTPQKGEDFQVCKPGQRHRFGETPACTICNASGTGWNTPGTDWGDASKDQKAWCECAAPYSHALQDKIYNKENYPQCF